MDSHPSLRLVLEVDPRTEPISGHLEGSAGNVEFVGWLGLASALEQLLAAAREGVRERDAD